SRGLRELREAREGAGPPRGGEDAALRGRRDLAVDEVAFLIEREAGDVVVADSEIEGELVGHPPPVLEVEGVLLVRDGADVAAARGADGAVVADVRDGGGA